MASLKNRILVPIDFSDQSIIALGQSHNLARLTKADITLIYVIEDHYELPFFSKKDDKSLEKKVHNELEKLARETSKKFGIQVNNLVAHGRVYEEVQKAAKKLKCSFIIMGTNGRIGFKKRFIGSNALRVVRESPCPVITIKGKKHRQGCRQIVLPLDLSKETKEKVQNAIEIAQLFNSTINIVSVLTTDDEFIVNKLNRQLNQVHDYIRKHDVNCTAEMLQGDDVAEEVIAYAGKINADLIMIMTQQEMNWTDIMFVSSSALEIINGSEIPVLSIRPRERKSVTLSVFEY